MCPSLMVNQSPAFWLSSAVSEDEKGKWVGAMTTEKKNNKPNKQKRKGAERGRRGSAV